MTMDTNPENLSERTGAPGSSDRQIGTAAKHAIDYVKESSSAGRIEELGTQAVSAAAVLYREGRLFLATNKEVVQAKAELSEAIRRNPLAAVGVAFTTGIILSLITRGRR